MTNVLMIADLLLVGLLGATLFYCVRLNRLIRHLQDSKSEFAQVMKEFNETVIKAESSIPQLKATGQKVTDGLETRINKAGHVADDLLFMIERSTKLIRKLEQQTEARGNSVSSPGIAPQGKNLVENTTAGVGEKKTLRRLSDRSRRLTAEQGREQDKGREAESLKALKNEAKEAVQSGSKDNIRSVLDKIAGTKERKASVRVRPSAAPPGGESGARAVRSHAEQDLVQRLRNLQT